MHQRAKTDQTLRRVVHRRIRSVFGSGVWVMLCHPDEFFYHDPRTVAAAAQAEGADHVFWWALHSVSQSVTTTLLAGNSIP